MDKKSPIAAFVARVQHNSSIVRKCNERLPAGSPMYFYCCHCGAEDVKPESYTDPVKDPCDDCKVLIGQGLMEEAGKAAEEVMARS